MRLGHITVCVDHERSVISMQCPEGEFHRCTRQQHVAAYGGDNFLYGGVPAVSDDAPPNPDDYGGRPR